METKFKVGDKVVLNKPKYKHNNTLIWRPEMECRVGDAFEIARVDADSKIYYCNGEYADYWFCESWLTRVGEQATEQVTEQVSNPIDWEQRRWELYKILIMHYPQHSVGEALNAADRCIEHYKQTLK